MRKYRPTEGAVVPVRLRPCYTKYDREKFVSYSDHFHDDDIAALLRHAYQTHCIGYRSSKVRAYDCFLNSPPGPINFDSC